MYNSKCFLCNHEVACKDIVLNIVKPKIKSMLNKEKMNHSCYNKNQFIIGKSGKSGKYGPGYSHVLNSLRENEID